MDGLPSGLAPSPGAWAKRFCHRIIAAHATDVTQSVAQSGYAGIGSILPLLLPSRVQPGPAGSDAHLTQNPLEERLKHTNPRSVAPSSSSTISRGSGRASSSSIASAIGTA